MTVEIVILAMIAAFLGLRLYSVLGRRAEHEEEPIPGRFEGQSDEENAPRTAAPPAADERPNSFPNARTQDFPAATPMVERGLRDIAAADRRFDAFSFMEGARHAYRMILEAFWNGDKEELRLLCEAPVYQSFADAIDARQAAGETLDNRLVRIEETAIVSAGFESPHTRITVRFHSDIAAVTRDVDGNVIAGSLDDAIETIDVWSFSRDVNSTDPDWLLEESDQG